MSASNTYGAVLTVRWLRLQRGRWVWLTLLPTILGIPTPSGSGSSFAGQCSLSPSFDSAGILALRQLHVVNEVYKRAHSPAPP